jgi:hypothetical protein
VATDAATAADAIFATNPYCCLPSSPPQISNPNHRQRGIIKRSGGEKQNFNIPLNPQNHRYLLLSQHNINIFSLSTSSSSSPCFLSAIKIAHQINQETPKKKKN